MIVLGLCGSLRQGSHNRQLLTAAAAVAPGDVRLIVFDGLRDLPPYDADIATPDTVQAQRNAIAAADAVLIATPEYNASVPGQLKNALDWASQPYPDNALHDRPVAVVGASTGIFGAVGAQAEARKVLKAIGGDVLDDVLPLGRAHDAFRPDGRLVDRAVETSLTDIVARLVERARHVARIGG